jgi:hypothetical protein
MCSNSFADVFFTMVLLGTEFYDVHFVRKQKAKKISCKMLLSNGRGGIDSSPLHIQWGFNFSKPHFCSFDCVGVG